MNERKISACLWDRNTSLTASLDMNAPAVLSYMSTCLYTLVEQTVQCSLEARVPRKGGEGAGRAGAGHAQRRPTELSWQNDRDTPLRTRGPGFGSGNDHPYSMCIYVRATFKFCCKYFTVMNDGAKYPYSECNSSFKSQNLKTAPYNLFFILTKTLTSTHSIVYQIRVA